MLFSKIILRGPTHFPDKPEKTGHVSVPEARSARLILVSPAGLIERDDEISG
jgi:hypothetical protein